MQQSAASPPNDPLLVQRIHKLVEYTSRNGQGFIEQVRAKQQGNPDYAFLTGGEGSTYFNTILASQLAGRPIPPPAQQPLSTTTTTQPPLPQAHHQHQEVPSNPPLGHTKLPPDVVSGWTAVLDALNNSRESIQASQAWFMACYSHYANGMAQMMMQRVITSTDHQTQINLIYLANDILLKAHTNDSTSGGSNNNTSSELQVIGPIFQSKLGRMLHRAYSTGGQDIQQKLVRVVNLWSEKGVYDGATTEALVMQMMGIAAPPPPTAPPVLTVTAVDSSSGAAAAPWIAGGGANQPPPPSVPPPPQQQYYNNHQQQQPPPIQPLTCTLPPYPPGGPHPSFQGPYIQYPHNHHHQQQHPIVAGYHYQQQQPPLPQQHQQPYHQNPPPPAGNYPGYHNTPAAFPPQQPLMQPPPPYAPPHIHPTAPPFNTSHPSYQQQPPPPPLPPPPEQQQPVQKEEEVIGFDPMSFPPGLLPKLVSEKLERDNVLPYTPLSADDVEQCGLPPPAAMDDYLKSRVDKFYAQLEDYRPGQLFADIEVEAATRQHKFADRPAPGPLLPGGGGHIDDGSFQSGGKRSAGSRARGLGYGTTGIGTAGDGGTGTDDVGDEFDVYRHSRSGAYHAFMTKTAKRKRWRD